MRSQVVRRACVAALALTLAAPLLRTPMSFALIARGDDFLYRGKPQRAVGYYERAIALDPPNEVAVDRFAFFALETGDRANIERSLRAANRFLKERDDANVRADRALCDLRLRRYGEAAVDFAIAGRALRDPRYLTFAGWAAFYAGRRTQARAMWNEAGAFGFQPARAALRHLQ